MDRKISEAQTNDLKFRIREGFSEGVTYLNIVKKNGEFIDEIEKSSMRECKEFAFEKYKIPADSWYEMKFQIFEMEYKGKRFRIEEDYPEVGAYLFVYDENGKGLYDYVQINVDQCKEFAFEEFQVPLDKWEFKGYTV